MVLEIIELKLYIYTVNGMLCVWQLIIYICSYYIGLENIKNYFMINMVLESMNYSGTINGYYRTVLE